MLDSAAGEVVWMKKLVPRRSNHLGLGVTEVKLTATDKARTISQCVRLLLQLSDYRQDNLIVAKRGVNLVYTQSPLVWICCAFTTIHKNWNK